MDRMTISEAERDLAGLVERVYSEGVTIGLQRGEQVVAYLTPAPPQSQLKVGALHAFLQGLPKLQDDTEGFLNDVRTIRRTLPAEADPWA